MPDPQDTWKPPTEPINPEWKPPSAPVTQSQTGQVNQPSLKDMMANVPVDEAGNPISQPLGGGLREMMEPLARPSSLGDILGLTLPGAVPSIGRIFGKTPQPFNYYNNDITAGVDSLRSSNVKPTISTEPATGPLTPQNSEYLRALNKETADNFYRQQQGQQLSTGLNKAIQITGPSSPAQAKLLDAIKSATPLRAEQEAMYTAERGQRIKQAAASNAEGEQWAKEYMGSLKGEMPKVTPARTMLEQGDVDSLLTDIKTSQRLTDWERPRAITGLGKLLSGSAVPQDNELAALRRVFGDEIVKSASNLRTIGGKAPNLISNVANFAKSMEASLDLSAPFRQGVGLIHRKEWWQSWDDMVKSFGSENFFNDLQESLRNQPHFELGQRAGLSLTDLTQMSNREEQFMSQWAEKVPGVRRSEQAYVGFLNKLRSDTFEGLIQAAKDAGLNPEQDENLAKEIAGYINTATGRGSLGSLEKYAQGLNSALFSPRFIASRLQMLYPGTYINASPFVRKQYVKSLFAIATAGNIVNGLGVAAGGKAVYDMAKGNLFGASVPLGPTNADFGKVQIGNTRIDPGAGFNQYLVLAGRLLTNQFTSSTTGKTYEMGTKYGGETRGTVLGNFALNKTSPLVKFVGDWLLQSKDKPFSVPDRVERLFAPMFLQDIIDVAKDNPGLLPFAAPASLTGIGVQTYDSPELLSPAINFNTIKPHR